MSNLSVPYLPLDPMQRRVAEEPVFRQGSISILGGHGTGKTHVLLARVVHLLKNGVDPGQITYTTFTPRMAEEFRGRLDRLPPEYFQPTREVFVGTPAQYSVHFLRRARAAVLGIPAWFTLWDGEQEDEAITRIWRQVTDGEPTDADARKEFRRWIMPNRGNLRGQRIPPPYPFFGQVWDRLEREKRSCCAAAIEDLVPLAVRALEEDQAIRRAWSDSRSRHLLVDGIQDATQIQRALLDLMNCPGGSPAVTFDPNQNVARNFGTGPLGDWPSGDAWSEGGHLLKVNHRSREMLVNAAKELTTSGSLPGLANDYQSPVRPGGSPPLVKRIYNEDEANDYLLTQIMKANQAGTGGNDIAVSAQTRPALSEYDNYWKPGRYPAKRGALGPERSTRTRAARFSSWRPC